MKNLLASVFHLKKRKFVLEANLLLQGISHSAFCPYKKIFLLQDILFVLVRNLMMMMSYILETIEWIWLPVCHWI